MKKVLTEQDISAAFRAGERKIHCEAETILTPSAKDMVKKLGIELKLGHQCDNYQSGHIPQSTSAEEIRRLVTEQVKRQNLEYSDQKVDALVSEIMKRVDKTETAGVPFVKEADCSGIRLIRGNTVKFDVFDTGNPKDRVGTKDISTIQESPNMAAGFMTFEKSAFDWTLGYDEFDYVVEGNLDIIVNGKTYHGYQGDVFFIPAGTSITFSVPDFCRFFFVTYPANWQELSN